MSAAAVGVTAAALVGIIVAALQRRSAEETTDTPTRAPHTQPVTPPVNGDEATLSKLACGCSAASPDANDGEIAGCIWAALYPAGPTWPPIEGDHETVHAAGAAITRAVGESRIEGACDVTPPESGPEVYDIRPWIDVVPSPGHFYQVRAGDEFLGDKGIVARALFRATYEAALAVGDLEQVARSKAAAVASDNENRIAYLMAIQQCEWNAKLYATYGWGPAAWATACGLAIRLLPKHQAVYDRISRGLAPTRLMSLGTPADQGKGNRTGSGDFYELLWLPALDGTALLDTLRQVQVVVDGPKWPDGSPMTLPPPGVQALGIEGVPQTDIDWRCTA
jgi:hypothetical protein